MTGHEIRAIRQAAGLTQTDFARRVVEQDARDYPNLDRLGTTCMTVSKWERGRAVPEDRARAAIARAFAEYFQ